MTRLALPGTIPGLLRRGSPVVCLHDGEVLSRGVIVKAFSDGALMAWANTTSDGGDYAGGEPLDWGCLHLDLTDATGRAHAAWWLVETLDHSEIPQHSANAWRRHRADNCWKMFGIHGMVRFNPVGPKHNAEFAVPSLARLNAKSVVELDDGYLRVDAEALRLVCLAVAGLAVPEFGESFLNDDDDDSDKFDDGWRGEE